MSPIPLSPPARLAAALAMVAAVCACGRPAEPPAKIYVQEREAMERAKAVNDTVKQQAEDQRKKIEDAEK